MRILAPFRGCFWIIFGIFSEFCGRLASFGRSSEIFLDENKDDLPPVSEDIDQFELEEVKHDEKNSSENDDEDVDFGW